MAKNFTYSLKTLNDDDRMEMAYWLYKLAEDEGSIEDKPTMGLFYSSLVEAMNLTDHAFKVLNAMIKKNLKEGSLTLKKMGRNDCHPFSYSKKLPENYMEDENFEMTPWRSTTLIDVSILRAVFGNRDNEEAFREVVYYTFFGKRNDSLKYFRIPSDFNYDVKIDSYGERTERVDNFGDNFAISKKEKKLLNAAYLIAETKELSKIQRDMDFLEMYGKMCGLTRREVRLLLTNDKLLVSYGILRDDGSIPVETIDAISADDIKVFFNDIVHEDDKKEIYDVDSFDVTKSDTVLIERLLNNTGSANILFYGAAGSGKTQFARSIARESGKKIYHFKNELEVAENDRTLAVRRLNSYLSLEHKDSILIVDEAESVLNTKGSFFGMPMNDSVKKGTVNNMMENSKNKVIWILNYTDGLDESTLRRFTYGIKFNQITTGMLKQIADYKFKNVKMSESLHSAILDLCGKYKVTGASVENIVKTVQGMDLKKVAEEAVISDIKKVLKSNSMLVYGESKMRDKVADTYDLSVLNSSVNADKIVKMVENAKKYEEKTGRGKGSGIRILLYGVSGTGKTEWARYLAQKLDKKILIKRASDILGKYVGESEKHIKEAFEEASESDSILLLDEADSFFGDRSNAARSYEITLTNELLTQMEEFEGILICTTNLKNIMDQAMNRRFHIISEFKPLNRDGIEKLLKKFFGQIEFSESHVDRLARFSSVTPGDFGVLAGKVRFMDEEEINADCVVEELIQIQNEKNGSSCGRIGFAC